MTFEILSKTQKKIEFHPFSSHGHLIFHYSFLFVIFKSHKNDKKNVFLLQKPLAFILLLTFGVLLSFCT